MRLTLKPFGSVDPGVLRHLVKSLEPFGEVAVASAAPLPAAAYDPERRQYRASGLFDVCLAEAGDRVLGVTEADLFDDHLRFVFGYAQIGGRAAVISVARLGGRTGRSARPPTGSRGLAARRRRRFLERCEKEAVHEFGHTLGLTHDDRHAECVMYYSNNLADTDRKGRDYCPECKALAEITLKRQGT